MLLGWWDLVIVVIVTGLLALTTVVVWYGELLGYLVLVCLGLFACIAFGFTC